MNEPQDKSIAEKYEALRIALQDVVNARITASVMVSAWVATVNITDGNGNTVLTIAPPSQPMAMDLGLHKAGTQLMDMEMNHYLNRDED